MSKTTQKKNVSYRLLAVLLLAACVGAFFLPFAVIVAGVAGNITTDSKTLINIIKALIDSGEKLFGFLPVLTKGGLSELTLAVGLIVWAFPLTLVIAGVLSLVALFAKKKAPKLVRTALYFMTAGSALYALSIAMAPAFTHGKVVFDLFSVVLFAVGAVFYFILMFPKTGKAAWMNGIHLVLSLAVAVCLMLGLAATKLVKPSFLGSINDTVYRLLILVVIALVLFNVIIGSFRAISKKGLSGDPVRYAIQLVVAALVCWVCFAVTDALPLYPVIAVAISVLQLIFVTAQLVSRSKRRIKEAAEAKLAGFEKEEYVEAIAYEGGPVAGVLLAEEVSAVEKVAEEGATPRCGAVAGYDFYNTKSFDPFIATLNDKEREEFTDLYILKCKGNRDEIPQYVVGGDNKAFFDKVFIYLGQYREKIPNELLSKMYKFSMKIS